MLHLHPHWLTLVRPVLVLLLVVGLGSFGLAAVPPGQQQGLIRMGILAVTLVLLLGLVAVPVLRWRTTHYVITTHRLLMREGILTRRGRDLGLSRVTDVSYRQTLGERLVDSGTLLVESAGDGGPTVLRRIPDSDGVQRLLNHMIEEDADRRARAATGHPSDAYGSHAERGWLP